MGKTGDSGGGKERIEKAEYFEKDWSREEICMKKWMVVILTAAFCLQGCSKKNSEELIQEYIKNAESFYKRDDYMEASGWMDSAINEAEEQYGKESQRVAELYLRKAELTRIFEVIMDSLYCSETIYGNLNDKEGVAKVYYKYGDCYRRDGDNEQAIEYYRQTVEVCNELGEEMNELQFDAYLDWGVCESDPQNSLELYAKAEELFALLPLEKQEAEGTKLYYSISFVYDGQEQYEESIKYSTKAIEYYKEEKSSIQALIAAYHTRGYAEMWLGNTERAVEDHMKAKQLIEERQPDMGLWEKAIVYLKLAIAYAFAETPDYEKVLEYGLDAFHVYTEQKELSEKELEELKSVKENVKKMYDHSPYVQQQDFETWYQENINK